MLVHLLREYLNHSRIAFAWLHLALLLTFVSTFLSSLWMISREKRTLNLLKRSTDKGAGALVHNLFTERYSGSIVASLYREMCGSMDSSREIDSSSIAAVLEIRISSMDDLLRFCINGFVVVGLMGTLFGFYSMWRSNNASTTVSDSARYLENMATALVVSFIGLFLALITNFMFSCIRLARRRIVSEASDRLVGLCAQRKAKSGIDALLGAVSTLSESINQRTTESTMLITNAINAWKEMLQEFKEKTFDSVNNLAASSNQLAQSSSKVSQTMAEVVKGLDRTKDIGKIIHRIETTSATIIQQISHNLQSATNAWAQNLSSAIRDNKAMNEQHVSTLGKFLRTLTLESVRDFRNLSNQIKSDLEIVNTSFINNSDTVSAKWMTQMSSGLNETTRAMRDIVSGWRSSITDTSSIVMTTLSSSRSNIEAMKREIESLTNQIIKLADVAQDISDKSGGPIYLATAADNLTKAGQSLERLVDCLQARQDDKVAPLTLQRIVKGVDESNRKIDQFGSIETTIQECRDFAKTTLSYVQRIDENSLWGQDPVGHRNSPPRQTTIGVSQRQRRYILANLKRWMNRQVARLRGRRSNGRL
jgi:hypothetical protein